MLGFGHTKDWSIDTSELTNDDWDCLANLILERNPNFSQVHGIMPTGNQLEYRLSRKTTTGGVLVVDGVLKTGKTMEEARTYCTKHYRTHEIQGAVIFARGPCPRWIKPIFQLDVRVEKWEQPKSALSKVRER